VTVLLKGAMVSFAPTSLIPIPNVIVFQYNPETMNHTWTQPEAAPAATSSGGGGAGGAATQTNNPMAVQGMPGETFSFTVVFDANQEISDGGASGAIAEVSGVYSQLSALELLMYPAGGGSSGLIGAVTSAISSALSGSSSGPTTTVPASTVPVVLFIWGPGRIVPVRLTGLTITEKLYNGTLSPTHAEAQLTLKVLTPAELDADSGDILSGLGSTAYTYTLSLRQTLALANLANAAEGIIGMIPH
jgi:hypothetical protein